MVNVGKSPGDRHLPRRNRQPDTLPWCQAILFPCRLPNPSPSFRPHRNLTPSPAKRRSSRRDSGSPLPVRCPFRRPGTGCPHGGATVFFSPAFRARGRGKIGRDGKGVAGKRRGGKEGGLAASRGARHRLGPTSRRLEGLVARDAVEQADQLSHDSDEGDLGRLPV